MSVRRREIGRMVDRGKGGKLKREGDRRRRKESEKKQNERWDQGVRTEAFKLSSPHSRSPQPAALQLHSHLGQTQRGGGPNPFQLSNKIFMGPN